VNPRTFYDKNPADFSDAVIALTDCQGRMSDYKYAMYADTDEFIIPDVADLRNAWITLAEVSTY